MMVDQFLFRILLAAAAQCKHQAPPPLPQGEVRQVFGQKQAEEDLVFGQKQAEEDLVFGQKQAQEDLVLSQNQKDKEGGSK